MQSWGKKVPADVIPAVRKLKWLEPRHIINIENRWGARSQQRPSVHVLQRHRLRRVGERLGHLEPVHAARCRSAAAPRHAASASSRRCSSSLDWQPYAPTLQPGVFASRFPGEGRTLWTLVNRNEYDVDGEQLAVPHREGAQLLRCLERRAHCSRASQTARRCCR